MSDKVQSLSLLLECPICLGPFTDPRLLTGCFHTLCHKCLGDHIEHSGQGDRFQCPVCRKYIEIPDGKGDGFPRNFFANSCLDVLADTATGGTGPAGGTEQRKARDKVCSNSEEGDECAVAVQFCLDCCEQFCQQCSKFHRKTKAISKHTLVALDELTDEMLNDAMSKLETPSCPKHKGEALKLYCSTCQCAVCSICCHIDHQSHTFKEMKDVDEGLKAELDPLVKTVEVLKEVAKGQIREVDKATETYKTNASKARESVKGLFQQMQQMLSQKAAEIDQGICKKCDEAEALANNRSKNLVLNSQLLESLSSFAHNLQRKGSVFNRLATLPEVRLQVEKLKQSLDDMLGAPVVPEVTSHTDLIAESLDGLTFGTDIPLDLNNSEEGRKVRFLQTCNIQNKIKPASTSGPKQNIDNAQGSMPTDPQTGHHPKLCTVQVSGIQPSSSKLFLKLVFENRGMSGGGPVRDIEYTQGSGAAVVEFEKAEDAERFSQTCSSFDGAYISCGILDTRVSNEKPFALLVRGFDPEVTEQLLWLFFESELASGGTGLESIEFDAEQKTAVVSFQREEVVERVLRQQTLRLKKNRLVVSRLNPAPLVPYIGTNVERFSMIVQRIPTKCTKDELVSFLEKHSQNQASNVVYGFKVPYVTLVVFKQKLNFELVQRMCARYPLRGVMLSVQQVETLDSIQVCGVKNLTLPSLETYFKNESRSGGGSIRKVQEHRNQDCVIIKFCEPSTFHRVMKKGPHVIEKQELFVRPFIPGLGILPPGHYTTAPPFLKPASN